MVVLSLARQEFCLKPLKVKSQQVFVQVCGHFRTFTLGLNLVWEHLNHIPDELEAPYNGIKITVLRPSNFSS